jgi:hypothetical protein
VHARNSSRTQTGLGVGSNAGGWGDRKGLPRAPGARFRAFGPERSRHQRQTPTAAGMRAVRPHRPQYDRNRRSTRWSAVPGVGAYMLANVMLPAERSDCTVSGGRVRPPAKGPGRERGEEGVVSVRASRPRQPMRAPRSSRHEANVHGRSSPHLPATNRVRTQEFDGLAFRPEWHHYTHSSEHVPHIYRKRKEPPALL